MHRKNQEENVKTSNISSLKGWGRSAQDTCSGRLRWLLEISSPREPSSIRHPYAASTQPACPFALRPYPQILSHKHAVCFAGLIAKSFEFSSRQNWFHIPKFSLTSCVILKKKLSLSSEPQFSHHRVIIRIFKGDNPLKVKVKSVSHVQLFATPWTVAYQAPPSMGFSRLVYWSGLPFPCPGDLPDPGIDPRSPVF